MPIDKRVKKSTVARMRGDLVYYLNPANLNRDGKVFFEDFISNTMDAQAFFNNFQRHQNGEGELVDEHAKELWDSGIVHVDNSSTLRFFKESEPLIQQLLREYEAATTEDKPDVFVKMSDLGLDREGALEDEVERLRKEIAALKNETGRKAKSVMPENQ